MPACADMNNAMHELTAIDHTKTEQSIDMTERRMARDDLGMQNILKFF